MGTARLGVFYLQSLLARGGTADVWRAVHPPSGLEVAVKLLREDAWPGPAAIEREARTLVSLAHPAVVRVVDHAEVSPVEARAKPDALREGQPYLVMELGVDTLWARPPRPVWSALRGMLTRLLDGLAHAHARAVIHRDLKPGNVLWVERRRGAPELAIADFGLAALRGEAGAGSPTYRAPEQSGHGLGIGPWTDLYALGVMAREVAYVDGRPRFALPDGFDRWLARLCAPAPIDRFELAPDARAALDALGEAPDETLEASPLWSDAEETAPAAAPTAPTAPRGPDRRDDAPPTRGRAAPEPAPPMPDDWRGGEALAPIHVVGAGLGLYGARALPAVGREAERDALFERFRRVHRGDGPGCVVLTGASGVGKSFLALWMMRRVAELGLAIPVFVSSHEHGAVLHAARRVLGALGAKTRAEVRQRLEHTVPLWVGEAARPEIEALARVLAEEGEHPPPTAAERRAALRRGLSVAARRRGVIAVVDDIDDNPDAIDFAHDMLDSGTPIFVLATAQTEARARRPEIARRLERLAARPEVEELELSPLGPEPHRRLVRELLLLSDGLAEQVEQTTRGNPLFAVELVGDWIARRALTLEGAALALKPGARVEMPDDLHALWRSYVDWLTERHPGKRIPLELAAVLGMEIDVRLWRDAAGAMGIPVEDELVEALVRSRLAAFEPRSDVMRFAHSMVRESLRRSAREGGRVTAMHSAVTDALLARFEAGDEGVAEALAHHARHADRLDEALRAQLVAARRALSAGRTPEVMAMLDVAARLRESAGLPADSREECEEAVIRAGAHNRLGELDAAGGAASVALRLASEHGWRALEAQALHELGYTDHHRGKKDLARSHLDAAAAALSDLGATRELARCLRVRADLAHSMGQHEAARRDFTRARELSEQAGDRGGVASSLLGLALPGVSGSVESAEEARAIFEELAHPSGACTAYNTLAERARSEGRLDDAEALYREARRWAQRGGVTQHEHICGLNLAITMLHQGRYEQACVETELGARMSALLGQRLVAYMFEVVAAAAAAGTGRDADAEGHIARARELQERVDHADADVIWAAERAAALLSERRPDLAAAARELAEIERARLDR